MADTTSRYGIMEELNKRKIKEKEALSKLEEETDKQTYDEEKGIESIKRSVEDREKLYKREHSDWKREMEVAKNLRQKELSKEIENIAKDIAYKDENYENDFKNWKETQERNIKVRVENLKRYAEIQAKKIDDKKEIIVEIESGMTSLKEMSAEQSKE